MSEILIADRILTGAYSPLQAGLVCIDEGEISAVHTLAEEDELKDGPALAAQLGLDLGCPMTDLRALVPNHLVTPAFIDVHTHLALGFLRGVSPSPSSKVGLGQQQTKEIPSNIVEDFYFGWEAELTPQDVRAFVRMGAFESILSGVGLVWDHYYHAEHVAAGLCDTGLAGVVSPTLQDVRGPCSKESESALRSTEHLCRAAWSASGIFSALGPHATDTVSPELLQNALRLAEQFQLPIHMHLAQSFTEFARSMEDRNCTPMQFLEREGLLSSDLSMLLVHGLFLTDNDLSLLNSDRHCLVYCPSSQRRFGFPARIDRWDQLRWALATDCASSNDSWNLQKEMRLASCQDALKAAFSNSLSRFFRSGNTEDARNVWDTRHVVPPSPEELLSRVWDVPGALHPKVSAGAISAGSLGNLLIWDLNHPSFWPAVDLRSHLALGDTTQAIWGMRIRGERVGVDGAFHRSIVEHDDYLEAKREADERWRLLAARV
ncbi:MAG: amidohydrolase family protein [Myxococcota bacterium]